MKEAKYKQEEWRKIDGYTRYYASSQGRVKSVDSRGEKTLKQWDDGFGYRRVWLYRNNIGKFYRVHRLVARAFIPNSCKKPFVNHLDHVRDNNHSYNLEWCTQKENMQHAIKAGTRTFDHLRKPRPSRCKEIVMVDDKGRIVRQFPSLANAVQETGGNMSGISRCANGQQPMCNGYRWVFIKEAK